MSGQKIMRISISQFNWNQNENGLVWPYRELDKKHINNLVALNEPQNWGNLQVIPKNFQFNPDGYFWILDGQHRFEAAKIINNLIASKQIQSEPINHLSVIVRLDIQNDLDAVDAMFQANIRNGRPHTIQEKKDHLIWLVENRFDLIEAMTEQSIAKLVGLSQSTVNRMLNDDEETIARREMQKDSSAFLRSLVNLHSSEHSAWSSNKFSGSFKKFLFEKMTNDRDINKAIHALNKALSESVIEFDGKGK